MTLNRMLAFARCTGGCVIAVLGLGCAQIFGFDKLYELGSGGSGGEGAGGEGGTAGAGGTGGGGEGAVGGEGGAGGAGGAGAGGEGGTGDGGGGEGAGCVEPPPPDDELELTLIDDMEDEDGAIITVDDEENPRRGFWYVSNDTLGTQMPAAKETFFMSPIELPRGDSMFAAYSEADDKFTDWGALFGFRLNSTSSGRNPEFHDVSGFSGITFYAYAVGDSYKRLLVDVVDAQTTRVGGMCGLNEKDGLCDDHFAKSITLKNCWTLYKIPFSELKQLGGWGKQFEQVDLTRVWAIQFRFGASQKFKMWVDDVAFYK